MPGSRFLRYSGERGRYPGVIIQEVGIPERGWYPGGRYPRGCRYPGWVGILGVGITGGGIQGEVYPPHPTPSPPPTPKQNGWKRAVRILLECYPVESSFLFGTGC